MAEDEIFSFNFEIFNTEIFSLELVDDIFSSPSIEEDDYGEDDILSDEEWETLALAEEKRLAEEQARKDDRITWDDLSKFADSNRPEIAKIAREQIAEIEKMMKEGDLDFLDIVDMKFDRPTITEDIEGREFTRPIGGVSGGYSRRQQTYDDLTESGYDIENDLDYYAENFTSDQWQSIRLGYSSIRGEAIQMWEDETGLDYDDFQRGMYDEEDDY
tara:strand:- start:766 stop:1413 length:648 start_codon:yes stop_codon:yes gene_type:complete